MRLPNSYGSVYKLSGKRRNPYAVRKTVGWKQIPETQKAYPVYQFIGYYPTKQAALQALADYNKDPYDLRADTMTFSELYDKWSEVHYERASEANIRGYKAAYNTCSVLHDMKVAEIKLDHLQKCVDESGKNTPTLKKIKVMFGLMFDYAVMHEIVSRDKREMVRYVDIGRPGNPNSRDRKPFTKAHIKALWEAKDSNDYLSVVLMLIYTGLRVGELLELKKEDVHLEERWFFVRASKTDSGIREVPIAERLVPFFERWMQRKCNFLICTPEDRPFTYRNYYDSYWTPLMNQMGMNYTPHCTRHTCISLLTEAGADERIIQKIVGHKGQNVTQAVYTHIDLPVKLEAINRI